ncbi:MAG: hypothetical protein WCG02_00285 [Candidatus Taylorbacteria bacterium]
MNIENFNQNNDIPASEENEGNKSSGNNNLKRTTQAALAASMIAMGAVGCDTHPNNTGNETEKPDRFEKQSDLADTLREDEKRPVLDQEKLDVYFSSIKAGNFGKDFYKLTRCRAIDLAIKNGMHVTTDSDVVFKAIGGIPVETTIDGRPVPVSADDYTPEELAIVRMSRSAAGLLHESPTTNEPASESKTNPDLKDFL